MKNIYLGIFETTTKTNTESIIKRTDERPFFAESNSSAILRAEVERKKIQKQRKAFRDRTSKTELRSVFKLIRVF